MAQKQFIAKRFSFSIQHIRINGIGFKNILNLFFIFTIIFVRFGCYLFNHLFEIKHNKNVEKVDLNHITLTHCRSHDL